MMRRIIARNFGRGALALLALLGLLAAGCGSGSEEGSGSPSPELKVVSSSPSNGASNVDLSLTTLTVAFNHPVATTFDDASFTWPQLDQVRPFVLLENVTGMLPVSFFLGYDAATDSLLLFLSQPPEGNDTYELTLFAGLSSEDELTLPVTTTIAFTMGPPDFGGGVFANRIIAYAPELPAGERLNEGFYIAESVLGQRKGSLHVTSLGDGKLLADDKTTAGGSITVGLGDGPDGGAGAVRYCITDGDGPDFIVYENPFSFTDPSGPVNFTEAAYVEVSQDNDAYFRFNARFPAPDPNLVGKPDEYDNLAGINVDGDRFDLLDIIKANRRILHRTFKACYVRVVDAGTEVADYDSDGQFATNSLSGADIDAVEALNFEPAPDFAP